MIANNKQWNPKVGLIQIRTKGAEVNNGNGNYIKMEMLNRR